MLIYKKLTKGSFLEKMYKKAEVKMVTCPYNRAHIVSKLRLQKHITKCMEKHPDVKLVSCFYNYSHRFKPEDMLSHYEVCCNKTRLDNSNYETTSYSYCGSSRKSDDSAEKFPNINVKPKFFTTKKYYPNETFDRLLSSSSEFEKVSQVDTKENDSKMDIFGSDDSDGELEPLPLPKTASKAFVFPKSKPGEIKSEWMSSGFGRGKNLLSEIREPSGLTLQQFKNLGSDAQEKKSFRLPHTASSCLSVTSSMFDDNITLQSESIIFEESISEVNSDSEFVFKNFNKCTKI